MNKTEILKELIEMAEDGYKLHVSNASHQEFLQEDREVLRDARKWLTDESNVSPQGYGNVDREETQIILDAVKYGFDYRDNSQHKGEVPKGNILQWVQWRKSPSYAAPTPSPEEQEVTIGKLVRDAIALHELKPDIVEKELKLPVGVITKLMNDEIYTNSVPIVLFKNLIISLHIPLKEIQAAMLPTFKLLVSKETPESLNKKPHGYALWENEESVIKYTDRLMIYNSKPEEQDTEVKAHSALVEYIYDFAWHGGRFYYLENADKIKAAVSELLQLPEEFLSAHKY